MSRRAARKRRRQERERREDAMPPVANPAAMSAEQHGRGGQGESPEEMSLLADPHHVRGDLVTVQQAINGMWPVTDARRAKVMDKLEDKITNSSDDRTLLGAARAIIAADRANTQRASVMNAETRFAAQSAAQSASAMSGGVTVNVNGQAAVQIYLPENGRDG